MVIMTSLLQRSDKKIASFKLPEELATYHTSQLRHLCTKLPSTFLIITRTVISTAQKSFN